MVFNILYPTSELTAQHFCDHGWVRVGKKRAPSPWSIDLQWPHAVFTV